MSVLRYSIQCPHGIDRNFAVCGKCEEHEATMTLLTSLGALLERQIAAWDRIESLLRRIEEVLR